MTEIPRSLREQTIQRAQHRCEYCQAHQHLVIQLEVDHIIPQSKGGSTELDNLAVACRSCNQYKHDFLTGSDPETGEAVSLFNPRTLNWYDHFQWDAEQTRLIGLTAVGRATIDRLQMNREIVVVARGFWMMTGLHPLG